MAAAAPFETLSKWAYDEMFKRYTLDLSKYCSKRVASFCDALSMKLESIDTLVFGEMLITVATVSANCTAQEPQHAVLARPNFFLLEISPTSTGKTAAFKPFECLRAHRLETTGIPTDASFGSDMGVVGSISSVASSGGAPLLTADEGLDELTKFLIDKKNNNSFSSNSSGASSTPFGAARFLNMLYSGMTFTRAYKTIDDLVIADCFLSLAAAGTPVHFDRFRELFTDRGSQDGFRTRVLPVFSKKRYAPLKGNEGAARSVEDDNIYGSSAAQLMELFQESYLRLAQWFDGEACEPLVFSAAACNVLNQKRREIHACHLSDENNGVDETSFQAWRRLTGTAASRLGVSSERYIELTKKLAISFHLLEAIFSWIDFTILAMRPRQFETTIGPASVRAAMAFVHRCREQEQFYERMLKHCTITTASLRKRVVPEHADIILYEALTTCFLIWPGPMVTWESVVDRYSHWFLTISYDECIEAVDTLTDYGNTSRNEDKLYATGGAKVVVEEPSRSFRFYKMPPSMIDPVFLKRFGVHSDDYKARYEMEYMQVKATNSWSRGHQEWKDALKKTPTWLSRKRPREICEKTANPLDNLEFFNLATKKQRLEYIQRGASVEQQDWLKQIQQSVALNRDSKMM